MVLKLEADKESVEKELSQLGVETQTSHFPGECANHYTTVTSLSTLPYTAQVVLRYFCLTPGSHTTCAIICLKFENHLYTSTSEARTIYILLLQSLQLSQN